MSLQFYKILHIVGLLAAFSALGGVFVFAANGGSKQDNSLRKPVAIIHGIGLLIVLVSGFGMLAKLGMSFPIWVIPKIVIWLALGGILVAGYKKPEKALQIWLITLALGFLGAFLGLYHHWFGA